jgi:hypothetical protein
MTPLMRAAAVATLGLPLLTASTCSQTAADINVLLGSSAASTMLSYVAALDPTVSKTLTSADASIKANAAGVLKVVCGSGAAADFVFQTAVKLKPTLFSASDQAAEAAAIKSLNAVCPPAAPPTTVADAATAAIAAYQEIAKALAGGGVKVATTG